MKSIGINNIVRRFHVLALGLVMLYCSPALAQMVDVAKLPIGETVERKLKGGVEGHFYTVTLKQGQVLRLDVRQKGVDVLVVVGKNENERVIAASDLGFGFERETVTVIVDQDHTYLVLVRSPVMNTSGSYQLKAEIKDVATAADRERRQAELLLAEGKASKNTGNAESLREAIMLLEKALLLWEKLGDKYWEGFTSHQLGMVYFDLGEKQKALSYYRRALPLRRAVGDEDGEGTTLNNIGLLYSDAGERREALNYYQRALLLLRVAGDTISEAIALNGIGSIYDDLGEKVEALKYYAQALLLHKKSNNKDGEAMTLNNIGKIYAESGDKVMGRIFLYQALALTREIGSKIGEAAVLNNIKSVLGSGDTGQEQADLDNLTKSLQLTRDIGNRSAEAVLLSNIGFAYVEFGDNRKGLEYFNQALPRLRAVNDRQREAETLNNMMVVWERLGNRRLAIFHGKQAINKFQDIRGLAQGIDNEMQKTFLRNVQPYYQILVQIMLVEGQSEQAVQILNFYRDQEFFDFNRDANSPVRQTVFSPREQDFAKRYETTIERVGDVSSQIERLKREIGTLQPDDQKAMALTRLEAELKTTSEEFQAVLKQAETEFSKPLDNKDTVAEVPDVTQLRSVLNQLNRDDGQTSAVYTVVGKTEFHALIVTAQGVNSVSVPIKGVELNNKARQLWALLRTTDYDPTKLSNDLYNTIFKPIEGKLPKDTKTILWSLDGNLRYIPMAALHDGKQYLLERFSHVIFTRPDPERLTRAVSSTWTGYGFANSTQRMIEVGGKRIEFGPLDFVRDEMQIFRTKSFPKGILDGEVFSEDKFTKESLLAALKQRRRPLVHISSHFRFRPGDPASSFLLLGDGKIMTLAEMKEYASLFEGVELLTLSACDTAAQLPDATGREIDTFAELAQRLGAGAAMASLWPVSDPSTAQQMKGFYKHRQSGKNNKAEALRKAQLDLLYGRNEAALLPSVTLGNTKGGATSSEEIFIEENYRITFKVDQKKPFAHPYYWSPFILFGNWR